MMRRAFTLVELLVTVAIVSVLAALVYPVVLNFVEKGRVTQHLRTLGTGLNLYLAENNGIMPTLAMGRKKITDELPVIDNTLDRYITDKSAFACPSDKLHAAATGTSYHWNNALNGQSVADLNFMAVANSPGRVPVMGDKEGFHRDPDHKVNILYADGRASKELSFVSPR